MTAAFAHIFIALAVVVKGSKAKFFSQGLCLFSNSFLEFIVLVCLAQSERKLQTFNNVHDHAALRC